MIISGVRSSSEQEATAKRISGKKKKGFSHLLEDELQYLKIRRSPYSAELDMHFLDVLKAPGCRSLQKPKPAAQHFYDKLILKIFLNTFGLTAIQFLRSSLGDQFGVISRLVLNMERLEAFVNRSLRRLLKEEQDTFDTAGIKILFCILIFTLLKAILVIGVALEHEQHMQLTRALVMVVVYSVLLGLFLTGKVNYKIVAHAMIWLGLVLIWSNIFLVAQTINIPVLQFIAMLILGSFYLLGTRFGSIYAVAGTVPVLAYLIFKNSLEFREIAPQELASPGYEIIVVLNFATIIVCHYLFQSAFKSNIEEKEALNVQLQRAVEEANRAADSKSEFLSTMTHELRTPLNSVIGISQLLLQEAHNREEEENLQILKFSALNLYSLVNNILDFNKLGSEKLALEEIPVHLESLMKDTCLGLRFQAEKKELNFVLDIDEALKGKVINTDPTRITQIIYNLAGNAIKFTEHGGVSVTLRALHTSKEHIKIRFSVTDTGIGISPDMQEAIFESFAQASPSTARNFGGTGLGLAIVKKLLVLFDSNIELESTPGKGSKFAFEITFKCEQGTAVTMPSEAVKPDLSLEALKVLVAEDNQMNRLLLTKIFSGWHNTPEFALNGQEAIEKVGLNDYDVVLMDVHMPLIDGYEATRAIRAMADPTKSGVRIIALTATVSEDAQHKIREAGMDDYLYKPFKLDELYLKLMQRSPRQLAGDLRS